MAQSGHQGRQCHVHLQIEGVLFYMSCYKCMQYVHVLSMYIILCVSDTCTHTHTHTQCRMRIVGFGLNSRP